MKTNNLYLCLFVGLFSSCSFIDPAPSEGLPSSPLHRAVINGNTERVERMTKNRGSVDHRSRGRTALAYAVEGKNIEIAKILLQAGADPDKHSNVTGLAPLHHASMTGNVAMVRLLLEYGADPNLQGRAPNQQWTPILAAKRNNHLEIVDILTNANKSRHATRYQPMCLRRFILV